MRYRIEYFDHNEDFKMLLPREGEIVSTHTSSEGTKGWYLFKLDEFLEYQVEMKSIHSWKLLKVSHFLIRSRWKDSPIDGSEPTSVFILLVEEGKEPQTESIRVNDFLHVAWGMAVRVNS